MVEHLASRSRCRALFATHYHSLIEDWAMDPRVCLGHMDCLVQTDEGLSTGARAEEVTFLFKLCAGSSPRSYGINVARLAGLPQEVIESALSQSHSFEQQMASQLGDSRDAAHRRWVAVRSYFEKLVSIVRSDCPLEELASYARELWRRFELVK